MPCKMSLASEVPVPPNFVDKSINLALSGGRLFNTSANSAICTYFSSSSIWFGKSIFFVARLSMLVKGFIRFPGHVGPPVTPSFISIKCWMPSLLFFGVKAVAGGIGA